MRFAKRIKIGKGLSANLSRSGVGLSVGGPGLSMSFGKKGLYMNTGIPGTGVSFRKKVGGTRSSNGKAGSKEYFDVKISFYVEYDDNNIAQIRWGKDGILPYGFQMVKDAIIENEEILRQIKRSEAYKNLLKEAVDERVKIINDKTEIVTSIHRLCPQIMSREELIVQLNLINSAEYFEGLTSQYRPDKSEIEKSLAAWAKKNIKSILFWTNKKKRVEYVNDNLERKFDEQLSLWKAKVEAMKENIGTISNEIESSLRGDANYILQKIESFANDTVLPFDFCVDYDFDANNKVVMIDLDLPEIEDMPTSKASITTSHKISIKEKTKKECNSDYANCVTGLGFFIGANIFNISPTIQKVKISAYTQRISKKTGLMEDHYVYSVIFSRESIQKINFDRIDPVLAIEGFDHVISISQSNFMLNQINPL